MDKIIVITGGTSGIGLDLKNLFEANGDKVLTISRREINSEFHYSCDISNEIKVKQVIYEIGQKYGKIDILINNAGIGMSGITELIPFEEVEKLNNINFYGTLYTIRASIPFMHSGSKIVNISSAMALFPVPFRAIYGATKSAVLNLSYSLRMELKPLGIDVVAICPGDIKTNFTENRIKEFETNERYGNRLKSATLKSDSREEKRIPSIKCATVIFKKITKKKCKPMYIIGGKYKFLHFLTRITPKSWLLNITGKLYGGKYEEEKNKDTNLNGSKLVSDQEQNPDNIIPNQEETTTPIENNLEESNINETNLDNIENNEVEKSIEETHENLETNKNNTSNLFNLVNKISNKEEDNSSNE